MIYISTLSYIYQRMYLHHHFHPELKSVQNLHTLVLCTRSYPYHTTIKSLHLYKSPVKNVSKLTQAHPTTDTYDLRFEFNRLLARQSLNQPKSIDTSTDENFIGESQYHGSEVFWMPWILLKA